METDPQTDPCSMRLLGDNDLAVLVVATVGAHMMRQLGGAATGAHRAARCRELAVCRTAGVGGTATLLLLRNCHVDLCFQLISHRL